MTKTFRFKLMPNKIFRINNCCNSANFIYLYKMFYHVFGIGRLYYTARLNPIKALSLCSEMKLILSGTKEILRKSTFKIWGNSGFTPDFTDTWKFNKFSHEYFKTNMYEYDPNYFCCILRGHINAYKWQFLCYAYKKKKNNLCSRSLYFIKHMRQKIKYISLF